VRVPARHFPARKQISVIRYQEAGVGERATSDGKGLANPTALLMSSILMLQHLGERPTAERIEAALQLGTKAYKDRGWL